MLDVSELRPFCDETGYLSKDARAKFLQSKGIVRIDKTGEMLVKPDKLYEYSPLNQEIDYVLKKIYTRAKPEITADEINL